MAADEALRQKEELRQLQLQIKAEEDYLREQQRYQARARSEAEHKAHQREIEAKSAEKQAMVQRKLEELEEMRRVKAEVGGTWEGH